MRKKDVGMAIFISVLLGLLGFTWGRNMINIYDPLNNEMFDKKTSTPGQNNDRAMEGMIRLINNAIKEAHEKCIAKEDLSSTTCNENNYPVRLDYVSQVGASCSRDPVCFSAIMDKPPRIHGVCAFDPSRQRYEFDFSPRRVQGGNRYFEYKPKEGAFKEIKKPQEKSLPLK